MNVISLRPEDVVVDTCFNCRDLFTLESVEELAGSIQRYKQLMPVAVVIQDGHYHLVAGFRRMRAIKFLGLDQIWVSVLDMDLHAARVANLLENIDRKQLSMLDEAYAIKAVFPTMPHKLVGDQINRTLKWVKRRRRLLKMGVEVQNASHSGRLTERQVGRLQDIKGLDSRRRLFKKMVSEIEVKPRDKPERSKKSLEEMLVKLVEMGAVETSIAVVRWALGRIDEDELMIVLNR